MHRTILISFRVILNLIEINTYIHMKTVIIIIIKIYVNSIAKIHQVYKKRFTVDYRMAADKIYLWYIAIITVH